MMKQMTLAFILMLFVGGCATGFDIVPKPDQTGEIDLHSSIITKKIGGVKVSVQTNEWHFNPPSLEQFYTPFLFLIKNETEKKINFTQKTVYLVDNKGNQFQTIPPRDVEKTMINKNYGAIYPSGHIGIGSGGYSSFFGLGFDFPLYSYPYPPGSDDISLLSLHEGEILPGANIRGFVFFQRISPGGDSLKLHVEVNSSSEDFYFLLKK